MIGATLRLAPQLREVLEVLEQRVGFELTITSGYRTPTLNASLPDAVEDSEHIIDPSEGADILCKRAVTRFKILRELLAMGVRRIGIGREFIHVGVSARHPQDVIWHYYPTPKAHESKEA